MVTQYQRQHYRYSFAQSSWCGALAVLAFVCIFILAQFLDGQSETDELRDIAADKAEVIQSARRHAIDQRVAADARLAAIEYAREEARQ